MTPFLSLEKGVYLVELLEDKVYHSTLNKNDANFVNSNSIFLVYIGFFPSAKYLGLSSCTVLAL